MQRRQKTQRQRKYSVVWCHVVQILFYGFHSRWFTLFTNLVENWWKPSEISCPMCCKMALSKNKTIAPSFGTFLNFKIQKEISSLLLLQVLPFSLRPIPLYTSLQRSRSVIGGLGLLKNLHWTRQDLQGSRWKRRDIVLHIFQIGQVTSNKTQKRHHFLAQFSIPFHMVWSVLLRVVAQKTTFWLVEIFWQPIRSFYSMFFKLPLATKWNT